MGGYGARSKKVKGTHYTDTAEAKVTDNNAIEVAEYYIKQGFYVAYLHKSDQHPRADLSVSGHHVEVKGLSTLNPNQVESNLKHAFEQVHGDDHKYPADTWREGKVVLLSRHDEKESLTNILDVMQRGYAIAKRKGEISGKVEVWIRGKIYELN